MVRCINAILILFASSILRAHSNYFNSIDYLVEAKEYSSGNIENAAEIAYLNRMTYSQKLDGKYESLILEKNITQLIESDVLYHNKKSIYQVGDYYNVDGKEGIVFYIDSTGKHGKIISMKTIALQWSTVNTTTGANDMNDGRINMSVIQAIPNWEELFPAFDYCYNHLGHNWYLPAYNELKQIFFNKEILKNALEANGGDARLLDTHYSSSELSRDEAWMIMTQFDELNEEKVEIEGYVIDLRGYEKVGTDGWIRAVTTF